jgi:predicted  nucleic acid-binding Zn-ribbon protein
MMNDRSHALPHPMRWGFGALSCMSCLVLGASQASALPAVQVDRSPGFLLVQAEKAGEQPGSEQQAQGSQQAPFAELNKLLEDTRAKLEDLSGATATVAEQRKEIEALKEQSERLAGELNQANSRRAELEASHKRAEARIAELSKALDVAVAETVRIDEELAGARRQNADLGERLARAETARETGVRQAQEARSELQAKLDAANDAAEQSRAELAELREELERTGRELATAGRARQQVAARVSEMEQALERSGAEAERVKTELAAVKEQLGQAASAAVEAERARQMASAEADQLRDEAARARKQLTAANGELERFRTANADLEEQVASMHADSESAMETARQNLTVMEEKIEELHTALAGAGLVQTTPTRGPQAKRQSVADERSTGSDPRSGMAQPAAVAPQAAPGPADKVGPEQDAQGPARPAAQGQVSARVQDDGAGLARFDANVRYLNSRAMEAAGATLFSGIKPAGDGVVHVSTTSAWQNIPPAGQRSYLNSLFNLWRVAQDEHGPAVVRIVDPSGRVLLEKSGTGQHGAGD